MTELDDLRFVMRRLVEIRATPVGTDPMQVLAELSELMEWADGKGLTTTPDAAGVYDDEDDLCPNRGIPADSCGYCMGEACNKCGAGCWSSVRDCEHDVIDRHEGVTHA